MFKKIIEKLSGKAGIPREKIISEIDELINNPPDCKKYIVSYASIPSGYYTSPEKVRETYIELIKKLYPGMYEYYLKEVENYEKKVKNS